MPPGSLYKTNLNENPQKLLAELTIKLHMSNQQQQSEINCPMNVVSYAQKAFKNLIFQARPANAHAES